MWPMLALVAVASCGRVAFDPRLERDATIADTGPDTQVCGAVSQFADDFTEPTTAWWWSPEIDPPVTMVEGGGRLTIKLAPNTNYAYGRYYSTCRYDLRAAGVHVGIATTPTVLPSVEMVLAIRLDTDNVAYITVNDGTVGAAKRVGGAQMGLGNIPFDRIQHRFWRMRASATELFWELSPDRGLWTELRRDVVPFDLSNVLVELAAGTYASRPNPGIAEFDGFNL